MLIQGTIKDFDGNCLTIVAPFNDINGYCKKNLKECEIRLNDGRTISIDQRKKIYATFNDIAYYSGHVPDEIKDLLKYEFIAKTGCDYFSLSNVDVTTAKDFLQFLIEFCIENDIPTKDNLLERSPDIAKYIYVCTLNKKCCITGGKAELHHEHAVGMGRNRKEIIHEGMYIIPLCREKHSECHIVGQVSFNNKYHIFGIKADKYICDIYKLKRS